MRTYELDLLDEKALVILKGLEQLRIITLRPVSEASISLVDNDTDDSSKSINIPENKNTKISQFKNFQGAISIGLNREEIDNNINKMRDGWL